MKNVVIATPCYGGLVSTSYISSLLSLLGSTSNVRFSLYTITDSLVTRARNNLAARFLDTEEATHLFWIDADIGFSPNQFMRVLDFDKPVTCATYPYKKLFPANHAEAGTFPPELQHAAQLRYVLTHKTPGEENEPPEQEGGFFKVFDAPLGFMCIQRQVLEDMANHYPELAYDPDIDGAAGQVRNYLFFDTMVENGRYLSEDYAFCRRWQKMGGSIWMDSHSSLSHVGMMEFKGNLPLTIKVSEIGKVTFVEEPQDARNEA